MTDIVFVFEVHQPHRFRRDFFWENRLFRRVKKGGLFDYYFDSKVNRDVFERACKKCYLPSNEILLGLIDRYQRETKKVKFSFSLSGVFLEQCEAFSKDLLESFKQLAETGCVEFLSQTYYHSLASLYPKKEEFIEQVEMHQQETSELLGYDPNVFENTELLYNNAIAKTIENMGYKGIYTEGTERILDGKSPNYLYRPKSCEKVKALLRNYKLTDDIGFRFSTRSWSEWPLTAQKYAGWLAATPGECISIFPDYETFGEHHWPDSGIHEFLKRLPEEILRYAHLSMSTPSEVLESYAPVGEVDVPELGGTVSWADLERDTSGWLGNAMQWAYYSSLRRLEPLVNETEDEEVFKIWRYFQTSDHLYYMFTGSGGPGEVHSYFSPFTSPLDAYVTAQTAILDFENRVRLSSMTANEPFLFYTGKGEKHYTGMMAWSLKGFAKALRKVRVRSIEFHNSNRDFEKWAEVSLCDKTLSKRLKEARLSEPKGEKLRELLIGIAEKRLRQSGRVYEATGYS